MGVLKPPSTGQLIECSEFVAVCTPLLTAAWLDKNTSSFPLGLKNQTEMSGKYEFLCVLQKADFYPPAVTFAS